MYNHIALAREKVTDNQEYYFRCDRAEGIVNRHEVSQVQQYSNLKQPKFLKGEIIKFSELELGEKLGGGGFGDVHVAIWKGVYQVAVKKLRVQKVHRDKKEQFEKEVRLFSSLSHSAIVDFYGACINTPDLAIVMEFMPKGSLYDALHYESIQFSDKQKFQMIEDVLSALSYLHGLEIAHRDIKSGNILICDDMNHCKLADFGLALKDYSNSSASVADFSVVGTLRYSAPEILDGETLTLEEFMSADIYSVSLTIIELLTEKEPFHSLNQNQIRRAVLAGERPDFDQRGVPVYMRSILSSGMSEDASDRPSAEEFLNTFKKQMK
jgi:serine/threonine protein kinase